MNTMTTAHKTIFGTLALGLACVFALSTANVSASDHGGRGHNGVSIGIGIGGGGYGGGYNHGGYGGGYSHGGYGGSYNRGGYGYGGYYNGGYASYNSGYGYYNSTPVWTEGYYETINTPVLVYGNRYEDRYTRVYRPGCYR